jgi:hypothetical protein
MVELDRCGKHLNSEVYNEKFSGYQPCQLVKWRGKNNISRTIPVLVFRVLIYLESQSVSYIGLRWASQWEWSLSSCNSFQRPLYGSFPVVYKCLTIQQTTVGKRNVTGSDVKTVDYLRIRTCLTQSKRTANNGYGIKHSIPRTKADGQRTKKTYVSKY